MAHSTNGGLDLFRFRFWKVDGGVGWDFAILKVHGRVAGIFYFRRCGEGRKGISKGCEGVGRSFGISVAALRFDSLQRL